jgi:hypothetical protein
LLWFGHIEGDKQSKIPRCHENGDPLTRPTTAGENAVVGYPLPQGGEGRFSIFIYSGEPKDHDVFARNDRAFSKQ